MTLIVCDSARTRALDGRGEDITKQMQAWPSTKGMEKSSSWREGSHERIVLVHSVTEWSLQVGGDGTCGGRVGRKWRVRETVQGAG